VPLLFMGEEWGATSPFLFFCDFEPNLARAVTAGRRSEFGTFAAFADAALHECIPDPNAPETFARSTLRWDERATSPHDAWLAYYRNLLRIRALEIAPRSALACGIDADYAGIGECGLRAQAGFSANPKGYIVFSTHDPTFTNGIAPPWSVRWTID